MGISVEHFPERVMGETRPSGSQIFVTFPRISFLLAQPLKLDSWLEFCLFLCPMGPQAVLICPFWFPVAIWRNSDFLHLKSHLQFLTISTCCKVTCAALKSPHQRLLWLSSWFLMLVLLSPCYWLNHLHTYCSLSPLLVLSWPFCIPVDVPW